MQNETVSFKIYPFEPSAQVISIGIVQLTRDDFAAQFSVAVSGETNFEPPLLYSIDTPIYIEVGYDDNLRGLFEGKITEVELHSSESLGFYYTYKCESDRRKRLMQSAANVEYRPVLGENVLGLGLTNNGAKTIGSVKVQGTTDVWCDYEIDFSGIGSMFGKGKVSRVRHIVADANWTTEVFVDVEIPTEDTSKVVLQTPKGNSIILDDGTNSIVLKDAAGNSIKMGYGGIEITSGSGINTNAEYIKQVSKGRQIIKAGEELRLEGEIVNIN